MRLSFNLVRNSLILILSAMVLMTLFACNASTPTPETAGATLNTPGESAAEATDVSTAVPQPTKTGPLPGTVTPLPTLAPAVTSAPVTPSATAPPALHESVGQVAYAASDCSDKYPCNEDYPSWESRITTPAGFEAAVFARVDDFPTSITFGPGGHLFVAGHSGTIYEVDDAGQVSSFADGFMVPTGIAFQPGTDRLYVSSRVTNVNVDGEGKISLVVDGQVTTLFDGLPCCYLGMHGPNGIAFGPDGFGYVGVGGRADHGERLVEPNVGEMDDFHPLEASILRFSPDGELVEVYAHGFRNPYDIAWDGDGSLYATDNGRDPDLESGVSPADELHKVVPGAEHGYPYYECTLCFGIPAGVDVLPPTLELIPHAAVTGIVAYTDSRHPAYYNDLFLVTWSAFEGAQKVVRFSPDSGESSDFATGFAQPIDIAAGPDGHIYVADFATGLIYRIAFVDA